MLDDDDDLLMRTREDPEAFGIFYRRYERAVLGYFVRRTDDPDTAADLCAETFAAALIASRRYQPRGEPATAWLFGIARHKLLNAAARRRVEDRARRSLGMQRVHVSDEARDAIERLAGDDEVRALLDRLPADQAKAVETRVLQDRSYIEIAAQLRCTPSAIRKRVSRGLAALRENF